MEGERVGLSAYRTTKVAVFAEDHELPAATLRRSSLDVTSEFVEASNRLRRYIYREQSVLRERFTQGTILPRWLRLGLADWSHT